MEVTGGFEPVLAERPLAEGGGVCESDELALRLILKFQAHINPSRPAEYLFGSGNMNEIAWGCSHKIDWSVSTASPFTPSRCPPGEFASGKTVRGGKVSRPSAMEGRAEQRRFTVAYTPASFACHTEDFSTFEFDDALSWRAIHLSLSL